MILENLRNVMQVFDCKPFSTQCRQEVSQVEYIRYWQFVRHDALNENALNLKQKVKLK